MSANFKGLLPVLVHGGVDFILIKRAVGRPKDLESIAELEVLLHEEQGKGR